MIFNRLWERKIFLQTMSFMIFFLICIFFLFIIIDFSINSISLISSNEFTFAKFISYYFYQFLKYFDIFSSLSLLLATIKVLVSMSTHRETVALYMAGISKKELTRPFFIISILLSIFSYANMEFFAPSANAAILTFKASLPEIHKKSDKMVNVLLLADNTKLVYVKEQEKVFFDVFWLNSSKNIWHIKYLNTTKKPPIGRFVDHFISNSDGLLEKKESFDFYNFDKMVLKRELSNNNFESLQLSALCKKWYLKQYPSRQKKADLLSQLNYKLALPLTHLLIPLAITPFCLRFSRHISIFSITAIALFVFVLFFTIMDASLILADNQVVPPILIIWLPVICFFVSFGIFFHKRAC